MFYGNYPGSLRGGKAQLPRKWRKLLKGKALVLFELPEGSLGLCLRKLWKAFGKNKILSEAAERQEIRIIMSKAMEVRLDKAGFIFIPSPLAEFGKLKEGKFLFVGCSSCIEIWSSQRWEAEWDKIKKELEKEEALIPA